MSDAKRFQCGQQTATLRPCDMFPADNGEFVLASDHDAAIAAKDAEIERLRAALRHIGNYNKDARHMVEKGFHNTTLAIDLSDYANAALKEKT